MLLKGNEDDHEKMRLHARPKRYRQEEIRDVQKRMLRFMETGDLKRLVRLRGRLPKLQDDLDILKTARTPPSFRKSYSFEAWCEALAIGRKTLL